MTTIRILKDDLVAKNDHDVLVKTDHLTYVRVTNEVDPNANEYAAMEINNIADASLNVAIKRETVDKYLTLLEL